MMKLTQHHNSPAPRGRAAARLGLSLALAALFVFSAGYSQAQNQQGERPRNEREEVIKLDNLPSGRLQSIDWKKLELRIDGKTYPFNDEVLRVYYQNTEITLLDLAPNADISYQMSRSRDGNNVIVRIWALRPESLIQS